MNFLVPVGMALVFVGFALVTVGLFLSVEGREDGGTKEGSTVHGGGIIMIGPIPIVFGTDRQSARALMILAIVLIAVSVIALLIARRIL